ncbi:MAG: hypothetical protein ABH864_01745 [archaeon]
MEIEKEESTREEKVSKMDRELYWVFGVMVVLIAAFLVGYAIRPDPNTFDHNGLDFKKQMLGNIPLYKYTYFTDNRMATASGNVINTGEQAAVNVLLRNNPRENNVPVEGKIEYMEREKFVYITMSSSPDLLCEYGTIAMAELASFLSQNGFVPKAGISDETTAEEQGIDYVTCENHPDRMVISFEAGDENKVVREENCYTITVSDCEILLPTEKFIVQSILDAMEEDTNPTS